MTTSSPRKSSTSPKQRLLTPPNKGQNGLGGDGKSSATSSSSSSSSSRRLRRRSHRSRGANDYDRLKPTMMPHTVRPQAAHAQPHHARDNMLHTDTDAHNPHHGSHRDINHSADVGNGSAPSHAQDYSEPTHGSPQKEQGLSVEQPTIPPLAAAPGVPSAEQSIHMQTLAPPREPLRVPVAVYVPPSVLFPGSSVSSGINNRFSNNHHQAINLKTSSIENATTGDMIYFQVHSISHRF